MSDLNADFDVGPEYQWMKIEHRHKKIRYSLCLKRAGHVACMGRRRGVYRDLAGKPEGRRQLGRPRHRWEDNIKMDLREVGRGRRRLD
jgi:hypothetical protein